VSINAREDHKIAAAHATRESAFHLRRKGVGNYDPAVGFCPSDGTAPPAAPASPIVHPSAWLLLRAEEQNASRRKEFKR
jgi:hypothetical protein